jgi:hypothetical protein
MIPSQHTKKVLCIPPQVADGAAFARPAAVDCAAAKYVEFLFAMGVAADAVGNGDASTVPILEECDTDSATPGDWTTIATAVMAAVIPATNDRMYQIDVNLTKATRKRYIRPKALTAGATGAGAAMAVIAILHGLDTGPVTAAERGLVTHVIAP